MAANNDNNSRPQPSHQKPKHPRDKTGKVYTTLPADEAVRRDRDGRMMEALRSGFSALNQSPAAYLAPMPSNPDPNPNIDINTNTQPPPSPTQTHPHTQPTTTTTSHPPATRPAVTPTEFDSKLRDINLATVDGRTITAYE
ncbi:hypothetical protein PMIN02_010056 [Paraphaeosphaeria minitans]|uniref:Uncharacterized protein n=1 Tax=Paraphaeosphaeria minitans TaxID=565426 RepID=A0A9P6GCB6_9PLEO|nr:hypothetical protein PMIN01_09366 [Paraphaeosphaeria minitans]